MNIRDSFLVIFANMPRSRNSWNIGHVKNVGSVVDYCTACDYCQLVVNLLVYWKPVQLCSCPSTGWASDRIGAWRTIRAVLFSTLQLLNSTVWSSMPYSVAVVQPKQYILHLPTRCRRPVVTRVALLYHLFFL